MKIFSQKEIQKRIISCLFIFIFVILFRVVFCDYWNILSLFKQSIISFFFIFILLLFFDVIFNLIIKWKRTQNLFVNLSLCLIIVITSLITLEFGLRFFYRNITSTGDNQSYFSERWQKKNIRINDHGFRERNFEIKKTKETYRIAALGDSLTYGQGIPEENRFSNLIQRELNSKSKNRKVEVLNFGRPGTETIDHLKTLKEVILPLDPDFILLQWYTNDVLGHNMPNPSRPFVIIKKKLRLKSAFFYLIHRNMMFLQRKLKWVNSYDDYMLKLFADQDSDASKDAEETMKRLIQTCKTNEIPLGMVLFSDSYFRIDSKLDFLLERIAGECDEEKIQYVDMREFLSPYQTDKTLWANDLDPHPNAFANSITAKAIINSFGNIWISTE